MRHGRPSDICIHLLKSVDTCVLFLKQMATDALESRMPIDLPPIHALTAFFFFRPNILRHMFEVAGEAEPKVASF